MLHPGSVAYEILLDQTEFGQTNKRGYGAGIWGDSLGAISQIKLSQGAFRGNPPVSLVPLSLLVGFPDEYVWV